MKRMMSRRQPRPEPSSSSSTASTTRSSQLTHSTQQRAAAAAPQKQQSAMEPRLAATTADGAVFRLAQLPATDTLSLVDALAASRRPVTLKAAAASRETLRIALANCRAVSILATVTDAYLPYAFTLRALTAKLSAGGKIPQSHNDPTSTTSPSSVHNSNIVNSDKNNQTSSLDCAAAWRSGLISALAQQKLRQQPPSFRGGPSFDAVMVASLSASLSLRAVLETPAQFAAGPDAARFVGHIRQLQRAAGLFEYVAEELAPDALARHVGPAPPELAPSTSHALAALALAAAQALHVRRARLSNMSAATTVKTAAAVGELCERARASLAEADRISRASCAGSCSSGSNHHSTSGNSSVGDKGHMGSNSSSSFIDASIGAAIDQIDNLARAWLMAALADVVEAGGDRVAALRAAVDRLNTVAAGQFAADIAKEELKELTVKLDDANNDNRIVFQQEVPKEESLPVPEGRVLAKATKFEPKLVEKAETTSERKRDGNK